MDETLTLIIEARIRQAQTMLDRFTAHLKGVQNAVEAMNRASTRAFQAAAAAARAMGSAMVQLANHVAAVGRASAQVASHIGGPLVNAFKTATQAAVGLGAVTGGIALAGLTALGKAGVQMNLTLNAAQRGLTLITGSAQAATQLIAALRKEAATSSLTFQQMLPVAQQLAAVYGPQGIGKVIPTMRAFADAAAALSVPAENLQQALLGFRQLIRPGGAVSQEELNQITEALPGVNVNAFLTEAFGTGDLDAIRAAGITGERVGAAIVAGMQQSFGGAQAKAAGDIPIILSNFQDAWETLASSVTQRFTPLLAQGLAKVLAMFNQLAQNERIIAALAVPFEALGRLLIWVGDNAERFHAWLTEIAHAEGLKTFLSAIIALVETVGQRFMQHFGIDLAELFSAQRIAGLFQTLFKFLVHTVSAVFGVGRVFQRVGVIVRNAITDLGDWMKDLAQEMSLAFTRAFFEIEAAALGSLSRILAQVARTVAAVSLLPGLGGLRPAAAGIGRASGAAAGASAVAGATALGLGMAEQMFLPEQRRQREAAKDRADPLRRLPVMEQLRRAYQTPDAAEMGFMADWVRNIRETQGFLFGGGGAGTAGGGGSEIPRSMAPVGSLGGNVNPAPPMLRAMQGGGGGGVVYAPSYNLGGGAITRAQAEQILELTRRDLEQLIRDEFPGATGR